MAGVVATGTACGDDDAAVFDGAVIAAPTSTLTAADAPSTTGADPTSTPTTVPTTPTAPATTSTPATTATTTSTATPPTTDPPEPRTADAAFPDGGELVVAFTFTPTSSGERIQNPYIAVWVEDTEGNLVDTISLWYQTRGRGTRWLRTLRQWSDLTGEVVDPTSSGATRPAGTYAVAWDGLDVDGQPIAPGTYRLFVEAAREDGPYELSGTEVTFDGTEFEIMLPDDGELLDLSARLVA